MERVKLHGGPWDGRTIERRWSGTPQMQVVVHVDEGRNTLPGDDETLPPIPHTPEWTAQFRRRYELHTYKLAGHDNDDVWHYDYDESKPPERAIGPAVKDTGR